MRCTPFVEHVGEGARRLIVNSCADCVVPVGLADAVARVEHPGSGPSHLHV